jgi:hypothetical protein
LGLGFLSKFEGSPPQGPYGSRRGREVPAQSVTDPPRGPPYAVEKISAFDCIPSGTATGCREVITSNVAALLIIIEKRSKKIEKN